MRAPAWIEPFIAALRAHGVMSRAARAAGVSPVTVYARRKTDPDFAASCDEARNEAHDSLEERLMTTAIEGHQEVVIHQGQVAVLTEPVLDAAGNVTLDAAGRVVQRPVLDEHGRVQPLVVRKPADGNLHLALKHYRGFADRHEITGANGAPLIPDTTPEQEARRIAFALALGRKLAQGQAPTGDDIT